MSAYRDLADAVEDLKKKGAKSLSDILELEPDELRKKLEKVRIAQTYHFDGGTNPGDESTLYLFELDDNSRGFLVLGFGTYRDPAKSEMIRLLKKLEQKGE